MTIPRASTARIGNNGLPSHCTVLILDDQRFDRHRLSRLCNALNMECEVTQADSLAALNTQLDLTAFDLLFIDYNLPDGTGLDALEMIQMSPRNCNAASIMVTGHQEENIALEAMTRGCADFITKDELSPTAFERAVTNALQKSVLTSQVQAQTFARNEVERVLQKFAVQCAQDIKPMVSRMMRQLRDLRDAPAHEQELILNRRESVENSCMHLWDFLDELEKHHAGVMMRELTANTPLPVATHKAPQADMPQPSEEALRMAADPLLRAKDMQKAPIRPERPVRPKRPPSPFARL